MMGDKLTLSDALRQWLKKTILILQTEQFDLDNHYYFKYYRMYNIL